MYITNTGFKKDVFLVVTEYTGINRMMFFFCLVNIILHYKWFFLII